MLSLKVHFNLGRGWLASNKCFEYSLCPFLRSPSSQHKALKWGIQVSKPQQVKAALLKPLARDACSALEKVKETLKNELKI